MQRVKESEQDPGKSVATETRTAPTAHQLAVSVQVCLALCRLCFCFYALLFSLLSRIPGFRLQAIVSKPSSRAGRRFLHLVCSVRAVLLTTSNFLSPVLFVVLLLTFERSLVYHMIDLLKHHIYRFQRMQLLTYKNADATTRCSASDHPTKRSGYITGSCPAKDEQRSSLTCVTLSGKTFLQIVFFFICVFAEIQTLLVREKRLAGKFFSSFSSSISCSLS